MSWFSTGPGLEPSHIIHGFDWSSFQVGTVVDIGGSHGCTSIAIAREIPWMHFIVQDQPDVISVGQTRLPLDMKGRATFMEHYFFRQQPIKAAEVYLLRWILHDWSDAYAIQILRALIPALIQDSKIVICEHVMPEPNSVSIYEARGSR